MPEFKVLAILMLVGFFVLLVIGVPVAISLDTVGFTFGAVGFGTTLFNLLPARLFGITTGYQWLALPPFIFMGVMLEKSRLADDLLDVIGHLAGCVRGGIVLFGGLIGAMTGIVGATVITLGLLPLPTLVKRGYDKSTACGVICASGMLGADHPAQPDTHSPGRHHAIVGRHAVHRGGRPRRAAGTGLHHLSAHHRLPHAAIPLDERNNISHGELWLRFCKVVVPLVLLVVTVVSKRFAWPVLRTVVRDTKKIAAMMMFILMCTEVFALAFRGLHGEDLITDLFAWLPGGVNTAIRFMLLLIFVLGFFVKWIEISDIGMPLFLPSLLAQGVDPVWLAMLITIHLQSSFRTPPFGWVLFHLKAPRRRASARKTSVKARCHSSRCKP